MLWLWTPIFNSYLERKPSRNLLSHLPLGVWGQAAPKAKGLNKDLYVKLATFVTE